MKRFAVVRGARTRNEVEAYLPANFRVVWEGQTRPYKEASYETLTFVIAGQDSAGWGLDSYVIPRLVSGSLACKEIETLDPAASD